MSPKGEIKARAKELGFCKVGFAEAKALPEAEHLREWLLRRYHAGMGWMARNPERRLDPRLLVPGARSVIVAAMNYYTPQKHTQNPRCGRISRYALGEDYHDVLKGRLRELLQFIALKNPEARGRAFVDTAPIMEKVWAVRAGVGWQGKNSIVVTREFGSWVFLGEIVSNLDLEPDEPARDLCGRCSLCIEACPTRAIVAPRVVDSNRCIAYLTIEHRGPIPKELQEKMGNWIFGCDICQEICPWNRSAEETQEAALRDRGYDLALNCLSSMSLEEFRQAFRRSPIKRARYEGLLRNIAIAMRNARTPLEEPTAPR
ncbi:MAG: tRNA epoxyqueuosine(34) reductase QueG [bacterium]